jgi:YD repeat-containing protein
MATLTGPASFTTGYEYDALERMVRLVYPGGQAVDYRYNPRNLVEQIGGILDSIEYNEFGQRTRTQYANGVEQTDAFDPLTFYLQRSRIAGPARPEPYHEATYEYDAAGNPLSITDQVAVTGHVVHHRQFAFDALFRLTPQ